MTITTYTQQNDFLEELEELRKADKIRTLSDAEYVRYAELKDATEEFKETLSNYKR